MNRIQPCDFPLFFDFTDCVSTDSWECSAGNPDWPGQEHVEISYGSISAPIPAFLFHENYNVGHVTCAFVSCPCMDLERGPDTPSNLMVPLPQIQMHALILTWVFICRGLPLSIQSEFPDLIFVYIYLLWPSCI